MDPLDGYAMALRALEKHLERRRRGESESDAVLLARHPELRDVLQVMLDAATVAAERPATASPPDVAAPAWRGLPAEGQLVGGYRILRVLGQGGMGVVFLAEDVRLGRKVALKLVRPERLGSGPARERFWREAKLAARLEHPHICALFEVGEASNVPFMAMRHLEGETLAARIAARAPAPTRAGTTTASRIDASIDETVLLIEKVAAALHYAHEHGVVHRDVKPANIFVDTTGEPFVLDFGMARDVETDWGLTMTGELVGTPLYMPPEQVAPGQKGSVLDRRADVYSLGVTLYEALTGVRPFAGASIRELLDAIVRHTPPPVRRHNPHVPRDLDVVVAKAIDKHPGLRYATAADFGEDLRRVRAHEPVRARRAGPLLRSRRWVQRNPVAAGFLAVVATALVVIAYLFMRERQAHQRELQALLGPRLRELRDTEGSLYARWPNHESDLRAWEQRAERLIADARAAEVARARLASAAPASATTASQAELVQREALARFLRDLAAFTAEKTGGLARVRRNLAWAQRAEQLTITQQRSAWDDAIAQIAASSRYRGLRLTAQVDLVPLGPDPVSKLWEFGHPRSGEVPARGTDGKLIVGEDTGLVFVLLPGGDFLMGCQNEDPAKSNYDAKARAEEGPVRQVALDAFFIAKYELTQGQWRRLGDNSNPSCFRPGRVFDRTIPTSLAHPVESVAWRECTDLLVQHGLSLPTEAQWEYACRGGTTTPWWTGADDLSLSGRANLADRTARTAGEVWVEIDPRFDDGVAFLAPVDALAPNPFGLHHITGNVWEWCQDALVSYAENPRAGDGLRGEGTTGKHVHRGGAFAATAVHCRSAYRREGVQGENTIGLRPARRVH